MLGAAKTGLSPLIVLFGATLGYPRQHQPGARGATGQSLPAMEQEPQGAPRPHRHLMRGEAITSLFRGQKSQKSSKVIFINGSRYNMKGKGRSA